MVQFDVSSLDPASTTKRRLLSSLLLAALSVLFFRLAFPGGPCPYLAWIYTVPMGLALADASRWRCSLYIGVGGFIGWVASVWWLIFPCLDMMAMPIAVAWLLVFICAFVFSIQYFIYGYFYGWLQENGYWHPVRNAALGTVCMFLYPQIFPGNVSHSLFRSPTQIQLLELGGVPLLFFVLHWFNWLVVDWLFRRQRGTPKPWRPLVGAVVLLALVLGYGRWRLANYAEAREAADAKVVNAGCIQPNIPNYTRDGRRLVGEDSENNLTTTIALTDELLSQHQHLDIVAWPELPIMFQYAMDPAARQLGDVLRRHQTPAVVSGVAAADREIGGKRASRNCVFFLNTNGELEDTYYKNLLIPFAEFLPFEEQLPFLRELLPGVMRYIPGDEQMVFPVGEDLRIIPLVCYEAIFSSFSRRFAKLGGNVILNLVDDAWFGETAAAEIHFAVALYRSVELRVPLVRVTNSGISCFVEATGEIVPNSETDLFVKKAYTFPLHVPEKRSVYAALGHVFLILVCVGLFADLWRIRRQRHRGQQETSAENDKTTDAQA